MQKYLQKKIKDLSVSSMKWESAHFLNHNKYKVCVLQKKKCKNKFLAQKECLQPFLTSHR